MENKTQIKTKAIILMVASIIAILFIGGTLGYTFSRYTTTRTGTADVGIAKWAIKIGEKDSATLESSFNLTFKRKTPNAHVVDGKLAPQDELYADLEIDPTGTEVSVDWTISLGSLTAVKTADSDEEIPVNVPEKDGNKVIVLQKVCIVDPASDTEKSDVTPVTSDGKTTYSGTINLKNTTTALAATDKIILRVYVKWNSTDTETDNAAETAFAEQDITLKMVLVATAKQHIEAAANKTNKKRNF